ncbi:MAG: tetratricopeptide repeat protein [Phycisphaerae bacterium]
MDNIITKYSSFWICLALMLITTAVFYQVCTYDFVNYDDPVYIYDNPNIQNGITPKTIKWAFTTGYFANWYPLTWLSHMLDWQLFDYKAGGHHLTNLLFHIANALLLFTVLKQMTQRLWPSVFVAALFALHPLHVESVAWVAERKDVLSGFFWMLTMLAYLRYVKRPGAARYLLTLLAFAMGLMAKPMLVTIPFVLLLLDYWPLARVSFERQTIYRLIQEKIPFFVLSVISSVVTFFVQRSSGTVAELVRLSLKIRIFNSLISYVEYIGKMIWPTHLAVFYPHAGQNISTLYVIISAVLLAAATILILRFSRNHRYLLTGWFWYLGTLVPVIGLVQVGKQALADRYTYIPLTGLFIIIAWGLPELLAKWRYKKIALTMSGLLIVSAMSICTHFQLRYWQNSLTLFQHALDVTGDSYTSHIQIADYLCEQNRLDEAIVEYRKCLQRVPDDTNALNNLGIALGKQGKFEEAIKCFTEALRIKPDAATHANAGHVLALQGNLAGAAVHFTEALRLDPNYAQAHYYLGHYLAQRGKYNEAITHFEDAMRLIPEWVEPMNNLAWLLAASKETTIHNPVKAVGLAERACELTNYRRPDLLDTLAAAYAATGDFSKAIETAEKASGLCQSPGQNTLKKEIENRLVLYKAGKPYIETL